MTNNTANDAMIKIQIKSIYGSVLFEYEKENNTTKNTLMVAVKKGADLRGADLRGADLRGADLSFAYLRGANLSFADLRGADLRDAYLRDADLSFAYLRDANLSFADLRGADLRGADLSDANLSFADLRGAKEIPYIPLACPSDGAFIGWKKVAPDYLVMLEIPEDARRCSSTTQKCRCDKAKVLGITNIKTNEVLESVVNSNCHETTYTIGEMVYPDSFDENRWNECSHGIHFFINKQDALDY